VSDQHKIAKNLERWRRAVATHDMENPTHESYGIGLARFDLDRLGLDEGDLHPDSRALVEELIGTFELEAIDHKGAG
jgi:hypothetical protein